jgi:SNF2 family DNA or RNA helicase
MQEFVWAAGQEDQIIGQVHRIGQLWEALAYSVVLDGSIDEYLSAMIDSKALLGEVITTSEIQIISLNGSSDNQLI